VGGQQLAALEHRVDDRGHVVVVHPRAEERELRADVRVLPGERLEVRVQLLLGHRRWQRQLAPQAHTVRQVREQLLDRGDADRLEHRLSVGVGQREVAHPCSARCCLYASASISASASAGSVSRTRTSQPSPYGSSLTVSGASATAGLTSSTSPESGAMTSETALTDSTSAYAWSFVSVAPSSGASKCTSSPSASCANQVIPSVASPTSTRAQ